MSESHSWQETDADTHPMWRQVFNRDWQGPDLSEDCPVCKQKALHRWYIQEDQAARVLRGVQFAGRGRLWEWCSACRTFEHYPDGFVPEWWASPYSVPVNELRYDPGPIEEHRQDPGRVS